MSTEPDFPAAPADVIEAALRSLQDGEKHLRATLDPATQPSFDRYLDVGLALRRCFRDRSLHDELVRRLKPHRELIAGPLPPGIQSYGLLPPPSAELDATHGLRTLADISDAELRQWLIDDARLVYGELKRPELDRYFAAIAPHLRPGGVMVDLGSGLGKVVMSAALQLPLRRCIGVELLSYRHRMAEQRLDAMIDIVNQGIASLPADASTDLRHLTDLRSRIQFIEQDMFAADVSDADLVFIYSTCFAPLMDALAAKLARELKQDCLVSTTTYALKHPAFRLVEDFAADTLAWTSVYLHQRVGPLDASTAPEPTCLYASDEAAWEAEARRVLERATTAASG